MKEVFNDLINHIKTRADGWAVKEVTDAFEVISHLKDRPCEACEFHKENGCCKWSCVFDDLIYAEHRR